MGVRSTNTTQSFGSDFYRSGIEAADPYVPLPPSYVDDVFSAYIPETAVSDQPLNINNGIDFATHGGLIWLKRRNGTAGTYTQHALIDTERNADTALLLPDTNGNSVLTGAPSSSSFDSDGFTWGIENNFHPTGADYISWSFRKQPGFFDIVTYPGDSVAGRQIPHSLGSTPGMIIIKNLTSSNAADWAVWHRSGGQYEGKLNSHADFGWEYVTGADATTFTTTYAGNPTNLTGHNYVAYLFAHDDQRFGENKDEAIIKCGGYTGNGSSGNSLGNHQDLGFEPQFLMIKNRSRSVDPPTGWLMFDNMRGVAYGKGISSPNGDDQFLYANKNNIENYDAIVNFTSTGFSLTNSGYNVNSLDDNYIYIAIRRSNKPKTVGTDVFTINTRNGTGSGTSITNIGFNPDLVISKTRTSSSQNNPAFWYDRVRGNFKNLKSGGSNATIAESGTTTGMKISGTTDKTVDIVQLNNINRSGDTNVDWMFRRAPGFFDIVAYQGTGTGGASPATQDVSHNLQAVPELMIVKYREDGNGSDPGYPWTVYHSALGSGKYLKLNNQGEQTENGQWNGNPTDTVIKLGTNGYTNYNGWSYVAYLFASLPGVSKIGTYSVGSGTSVDKNIDCGFSSPARFIMIKRYDNGMTASSQGNWGVWDTARGIGTGNDKYLLLNLDNAESTGFNDISEYASGFTVNAESATTSGFWNVSNASYIYLAIA